MSESTVIIRPTADGTVQMTPTPSGAHYSCVDEATTDDNDYVTAPAAYTKYDEFTFGTPTLPSGAVITRITLTERVKDVSIGGSSGASYIVVGGTAYQLDSIASITTSYVEKTIVRRTNPYTKCRWLLADLTGAVFRIAISSGATSGGTRLSQCYITISYVIGSGTTQIIRPNADKAAALTVYPTSPTTRYDKIDEATENTGDYVYKAAGGGGNADTYDLETPVTLGTPNLVIVHAKVQAQTNGASTKAAITLNGEAYESLIPYMGSATEMEITAAFGVNPADGTDWEWADFAAIYAGLSLTAGASEWVRCYQLWVEVDYTPTVYMSSISLASAGNGYVSCSGALVTGITAIGFKRLQVADEPTFASPLADSTELAADGEEAGDTVVVATAWTPSSIGTYYARLGVRYTAEGALTYLTIPFVVSFPTITSVTTSQVGEHMTVTVVLTDDYAQPPTVTVFIDGQAFKGKLN